MHIATNPSFDRACTELSTWKISSKLVEFSQSYSIFHSWKRGSFSWTHNSGVGGSIRMKPSGFVAMQDQMLQAKFHQNSMTNQSYACPKFRIFELWRPLAGASVHKFSKFLYIWKVDTQGYPSHPPVNQKSEKKFFGLKHQVPVTSQNIFSKK